MPRTMSPQAKKRTFYLHHDVLEGINALVSAGVARSQNALIEQLVRRHLGKLQRERHEVQLRAAYAAAMQDVRYRTTQARIEREFASLDREAWGNDA